MTRLISILSIVFFVTSCSVPKPKATIIDVDGAIVAVVFGEGIARSFADVGVMKALEEAKIPVHLVIGTGMGSLMGALYANKRRANDMEWHAMAFTKNDYLDNGILGTYGFISGSRVERFLKSRLIHSEIEKLPIPFISVTTNLKNGELMLLEKGPIIKAVQAGMAIPGLFNAIDDGEKLLVSGEVRGGIPVDIAVQKGADLIIAVDLTQNIEQYRFSKARDLTLQSFKISSASLSQEQLKKAHIVIRPKVSHIDVLDFLRKREALLAGYEATQAVIPELREMLNLEEEEE